MNATEPLRERTVAGLHEALAQCLGTVVQPDAAILDVGCGTGAWLQRLATIGYTNLQGTDVDTQQFAARDVLVHQNDLNSQHWSLGSQRYQLVTAIEVIEHLQNIENFLRNIHAALEARGYCLITTPNVHSLHARLRFFVTADLKQFGSIGDPTHLFPLLSPTLQRLAAIHRFEVVREWGFPLSGDALGARPWANLLCRVLRWVLPDPLPGDVYCVLLRKLG